ncbi:hypothetical protein LguiA_034982 [Lonicera macranthoides]
MSSTRYSPSRSPASMRIQLASASRLRSSSLKKPPEPLRRAIADCLSSSALSHHGSPSAGASEASRTLRDYLASQTTTDLAYSVILEHTLAERERSLLDALFINCAQNGSNHRKLEDYRKGFKEKDSNLDSDPIPTNLTLAKCLLQLLTVYKPSEETLQQIDRFCVNIIAECDISPTRKLTPWSRSLSQQSGGSTRSTNVSTRSTNVSPLPVSSFASGALVKSLNYVRSLVAQHIPKRSFQPAAFAGAPSVSRQSLPSLSSLLSRSFNSQLGPATVSESSEHKEGSSMSVSDLPIAEKFDGMEDLEFIAPDIFKWRWCRDQQSSLLSPESTPKDSSKHDFLEVGAAALLVGDMEAKMKGELWRNFGTVDMPYLDQLLQPSLLTTVTNSASARAHLRAITASKRSKTGVQQIWHGRFSFKHLPSTSSATFPVSSLQHFNERNSPVECMSCLTPFVTASTNRKLNGTPYTIRIYLSEFLMFVSEQQPLRLNPAEVCEVIAAVCSEAPSPVVNAMTVSSKLSSNSGKPSMDVSVSVLIKLIIDMYVLDAGAAAPLTLSMLEEMLNSTRLASKTRAFDLILNLGVHAHLLEPLMPDDASTIEEEYSQETYLDNEAQLASQGKRKPDYLKMGNSTAIDNFESWILGILSEILLHLVQVEEKEESVWASALSCLLYFVCDRGKIRRNRLKGLDIRVIKALMQISRRNSWAEVVHCKLICMLTNMFYQVSDGPATSVSTPPMILFEQIDMIGGIEFLFVELVLSTLREDRRNLYMVLFDYVLHQINEACTAAGVSEYSDDEVQPVATLLTLADAPEALHISIKLRMEGVGELLRRPIAAALSRYPNSDRLNTLLEKITEKFDAYLRSFTHLHQEFANMIQITKLYESMESFDDGVLGNIASAKSKLAWTTLHSLLHSERISYRHHGYVWLGDLLIAEISEERDAICSNIGSLKQKISLAGMKDFSASLDVPLSVWLMCGLLKSKNSLIRWGFLIVLDMLLMRFKFLLDENKLQQASNSEGVEYLQDKSRLEKAIAVIDIMSSALSLVAQITETDRLNILKMCSILFSQLCLKVLPATSLPCGDPMRDVKGFSYTDWNRRTDAGEFPPQKEEFMEDAKSKLGNDNDTLIYETSSMAALLLRGQAIVPMQLVARVHVDLFYWPLIQLAGEATDNIALGVSVGSKGRANLPGATSDIRATLLLLLIGKCTIDPSAFEHVGGEDFFRALLDDTDSRVAYYSSTFLLKASIFVFFPYNLVMKLLFDMAAQTDMMIGILQRMMTEEPERYQRMLSSLVAKAQQSNNEKLLENPYLQMRGILQLSTE